MRSNLKTSSFNMWRERVSGRKLKHGFPKKKHYSNLQIKSETNQLKTAQSSKEVHAGEKNKLLNIWNFYLLLSNKMKKIKIIHNHIKHDYEFLSSLS